jgi:hypothetical protein
MQEKFPERDKDLIEKSKTLCAELDQEATSIIAALGEKPDTPEQKPKKRSFRSSAEYRHLNRMSQPYKGLLDSEEARRTR